jgi:hypothetical protein
MSKLVSDSSIVLKFGVLKQCKRGAHLEKIKDALEWFCGIQ